MKQRMQDKGTVNKYFSSSAIFFHVFIKFFNFDISVTGNSFLFCEAPLDKVYEHFHNENVWSSGSKTHILLMSPRSSVICWLILLLDLIIGPG